MLVGLRLLVGIYWPVGGFRKVFLAGNAFNMSFVGVVDWSV